MAHGKNKTGPRNPDGSPKNRPSIAFEDRRTDQGNVDKQTSSVSASSGIQQLIEAGCSIVQDPNAKYKKGKFAKARSWMISHFDVQQPKLSQTADSIHMIFDGSEEGRKTFTISIKGMLSFKALDNIQSITGIRLVSRQLSGELEEETKVKRPEYMAGYTGTRWQPE